MRSHLRLFGLIAVIGCGRLDFAVHGGDGGTQDVAVDDGRGPDAHEPGVISFVDVGVNALQGAMTISASLPSVEAGDLLLAAIDYSPQTATPIVGDNQGNHYTVLGPFDGPSNPPNRQFLAWAFASASGSITCAAQVGLSTAYLELRLHAYAGVSTTAPVDVVMGAGGTATGPDGAQVALVTTGPNELIYALVIFEINGTEGTGFTLRSGFTNDVSEDRQAPVAGTWVASATMGMGSAWTISALALRPE